MTEMDHLSDAAVAHMLASSSWERIQTAATIHAQVLRAAEESRSAEDLAMLEAAELVLDAACARPRRRESQRELRMVSL